MTLDRDRLLECLRIERWADSLTPLEPASVDELVAAAMVAATPLTDADVAEALTAHPRIGERHAGTGAEAKLSASEQASSQSDDATLAERLAAGNAAYDARFERVFLIRAAGRDRQQIVDELERRLANDDATESAEVAEQLRQIAELRLRSVFSYLDEEHA
ncbi:2-oxo-4-hydroxy-4-carboxy-5-ureidoimidazoline decarboxylase [Demequina aurantiaca]|uniref:2-oxo-4-hydroxy-4-carboxy-5-ureidoimidazoline decarboxylase n=1 Tax=Demequina aurantiaca TaxID=676200 RepID=UPI003D34F9FB